MQFYTHGHPIIVHNDYQPLVTLQKKPVAKVPMRLQGMMIRLMTYDYEIE